VTELLFDGARGDESDLALALDRAGIADSVAMRHFTGGPIHAVVKADSSPVSHADYEIETRLRAVVCEVFPGDGYLGEEVGGDTEAKGRRWIVDGIDGTQWFVAGEPTWGTLIALEVDGEGTVGVLTSPMLGGRWWAQRGRGAFTSVPSHSTRSRSRCRARRACRKRRDSSCHRLEPAPTNIKTRRADRSRVGSSSMAHGITRCELRRAQLTCQCTLAAARGITQR